MKEDIQQAIGIKGIVTASVLKPESELDFSLLDRLRSNRDKLANTSEKEPIYRENDLLMKRLTDSCLVRQVVQNNIVTTAGLTQVTKGLSTNLTALAELEVNYTAVGSGTTTPASTDTTLSTETFRNVVNSLNYSSNIFFASMFIDFTEDSGTYYEAGLFINGTATTDSGTLFDHVLLNSPTGITKTTSEVLTISFQITFTPV